MNKDKPKFTREYPNDPGPRRWSKRAEAMRERRFNKVPEYTARRFGLNEHTGPRVDPIHGLGGRPRGR